jgi:GNAT superfamily N-acetyltransferase
MPILAFKGLCEAPRGTIFSLLLRCYEPWASADPGLYRVWERSWREYDDDIHSYPDTIGQAGFLSCVGDTVVGFGSWDPRPFPTVQVGHNCILPAFRGQGYGAVQLKQITTLLREAGFTRAVVQTGDVPFFAPARAMYKSCGFVIATMHSPGSVAPFSVSEYELQLAL